MSSFSVRKPFTVFVGVILIIILGIMSFSKMTTDLLPNINLPYMIVVTTYPGATPEKIENTVTIPLEQTLATTTNLKNISSTSSENISMVILEFEESTNMDSALIEINNKLNLVKAVFTDEMIGTPSVLKLSPDMMPVMVTAIDVKDMESTEMSAFINDEILPELEKTVGVATVSTMGLVEEKIYVNLNQDKIDKINEKILKNVDEELSKTENQLKTAQAQITKGKKELEKQKTTQTKKLSEGFSAISQGKDQIETNLDTITEKEKQLQALEQVINSALNLLKNGVSEENVLSSVPNIDKLEEITPDIDFGGNLKTLLQEKLTEITIGLKEITTAKKTLTTSLKNLEMQERQLLKAEITLENELNNAAKELESSQAQITQGLNELDAAREQAFESASLDGVITESMIAGILTANNFSMPAGSIETENGDIVVKVGEQFTSLDEIKNLTVFSLSIKGMENITLEQLADIEIKDNSDDFYAKVNGNNAVMFTFQKQSTASTSEVAEAINDKFAQLKEKHSNIEFTNLMDQGIYINIVIGSVLDNLLYGAILAIIVLFIFLRDIRPTIAIALSIPVSLTFAITLMYFTGVSVNIISLSGLALSVGMLVDNAIVVIENIYRLKSEGYSTKDAAIKGASSVAGAIIASTLTTICVFLPIIFIEGITRELFVDMALTIAYSLLASLAVALTVVPAMTSKLFKKETTKEQKIFNKIIAVYEKILKFSLSHKAVVVVSSVALLVLSVALIPTMGTAFIPEMEGTQMSLTVTFDKEMSEDEGNDISNEIVTRLLEVEGVNTIGAMRSSDMMGSSEGNIVSMYVILDENKKLSNVEIEKEFIKKTEDLNCEIEISTSNMDMSALGGSGIQVNIKGDDLQKLQDIAKDIEEIFKHTEGIEEVDNGIGETSKETKIVVDKNKAMEYGLTVAQVYSTVSEQLVTEKEATTVSIENKDYPIVVVKSEEKQLEEKDIEKIELTGTKDQEEVTVKLSKIAKLEEADSLNAINREHSQRYITVSASIASDHNIGLVSRDFEEDLAGYEVPSGYTIELAGENESINQALSDLLLMIAVAILFIYLIMVAQFQSLRLPFIVMFTIPLAFTGGLLALFITGKELSVIAMLGFLVLAGIIVNNGIVLIDYINQLREAGKEKKEAIVEAGKTRLRPIIMTALTTILGMTTMALGIGMGADMIQPLGITTIGGLIYATLLTLLVVPCMYDIMFRERKK